MHFTKGAEIWSPLPMNKVKMFLVVPHHMESVVENWLNQNPNIKITHVSQCEAKEAPNSLPVLCLTIFYT